MVVTCGATLEKLDDVRFITNFSSGKMGCAVAQRALARGAEVTLVLARHTAEVPQGANVVNVETTEQMYEETLRHVDGTDIFVMAAAPAITNPSSFPKAKLKRKTLLWNLSKIPT